MLESALAIFFILLILLLLLLLEVDLVSLVDKLLFAFNILEHIFALWDTDVIRENLRVVLVKFKHSRQSVLGLLIGVEALKVLGEVIEDEVLFEY